MAPNAWKGLTIQDVIKLLDHHKIPHGEKIAFNSGTKLLRENGIKAENAKQTLNTLAEEAKRNDAEDGEEDEDEDNNSEGNDNPEAEGNDNPEAEANPGGVGNSEGGGFTCSRSMEHGSFISELQNEALVSEQYANELEKEVMTAVVALTPLEKSFMYHPTVRSALSSWTKLDKVSQSHLTHLIAEFRDGEGNLALFGGVEVCGNSDCRCGITLPAVLFVVDFALSGIAQMGLSIYEEVEEGRVYQDQALARMIDDPWSTISNDELDADPSTYKRWQRVQQVWRQYMLMPTNGGDTDVTLGVDIDVASYRPAHQREQSLQYQPPMEEKEDAEKEYMTIPDPYKEGASVKARIIGEIPSRPGWLLLALPSANKKYPNLEIGIAINARRLYFETYDKYQGGELLRGKEKELEGLEAKDFELNLVMEMEWGAKATHTYAYGRPRNTKSFKLFSKSMVKKKLGSEGIELINQRLDHCSQEQFTGIGKLRPLHKKAWRKETTPSAA